MMNRFIKNGLALGVGVLIAVCILEFFLRLYNPFPFRLRGDAISLTPNISYAIDNTAIGALDPAIIHTKNALGFRGPARPENDEQLFSIIAVGGSTTECFYLSDDKTWPYLVGESLRQEIPQVWVSNAGLDGHSTKGHKALLQSHVIPLKPDMVIVYAGINDICQAGDRFCSLQVRWYSRFKNYLARNSEIASTALNLSRFWQAQHMGVVHRAVNLEALDLMPLPQDYTQLMLLSHAKGAQDFKLRMKELVGMLQAAGIRPVLVTQPLLWGAGVDPTTGINLALARVDASKNGKLYWDVLELYNEQTRAIGRELQVAVIDVAQSMPKNSQYYYDGIHYTNVGAQKIAEILIPKLLSEIKNHVGVSQ